MSDQILGQMTIFDFSDYLPACCADDLEQMTLEEVKNEIARATGLEFLPRSDAYYEARPIKDVCVSISLLRFTADGEGYKKGQRFISTNISAKSSGVRSPCLSVQKSVDCIRRHLPRYMEEVRAKK